LGSGRCFTVDQLLRNVNPSDNPNEWFVNNYANFNAYNATFCDNWYEKNQDELRRYRKDDPEYFLDEYSLTLANGLVAEDFRSEVSGIKDFLSTEGSEDID
jgi:uncharacterized protein YeaO (DUF488 family)